MLHIEGVGGGDRRLSQEALKDRGGVQAAGGVDHEDVMQVYVSTPLGPGTAQLSLRIAQQYLKVCRGMPTPETWSSTGPSRSGGPCFWSGLSRRSSAAALHETKDVFAPHRASAMGTMRRAMRRTCSWA